jgi:hypothetical protein
VSPAIETGIPCLDLPFAGQRRRAAIDPDIAERLSSETTIAAFMVQRSSSTERISQTGGISPNQRFIRSYLPGRNWKACLPPLSIGVAIQYNVSAADASGRGIASVCRTNRATSIAPGRSCQGYTQREGDTDRVGNPFHAAGISRVFASSTSNVTE